jgi:hypothetical protein
MQHMIESNAFPFLVWITFSLNRSEFLGGPLSFVISTFGAYFLRNQLREKKHYSWSN